MLGSLVVWPGVYVHADTALHLLLRDGNAVDGLRRVHPLHHTLDLELPQVSRLSLLVVIGYWVHGWLHKLEPVLVPELHLLNLHCSHSVHEDQFFIPVDDLSGLFLALGLDLVERGPLSDDFLARLPELGGDKDVHDVLVDLVVLVRSLLWAPLLVEADDTQVLCITVLQEWLRPRPRHHVHPGPLGRSTGGGQGHLEHALGVQVLIRSPCTQVALGRHYLAHGPPVHGWCDDDDVTSHFTVQVQLLAPHVHLHPL